MRFSKKTHTQSFDDLPVDSVSYSPKSSASTPSELDSENVSSKSNIGHKITLIGELSGAEDILIDGTLEGSINLEGYTVSIGAQGSVESNIKARSIVAEGNVTGDVEAQDLITVKSGSHVHGNLKSNRVQLDEGAHFWGGVNITHTVSRPNC